jgi:prepilin-type N-terminal cleavage/methylation domain-containing protein
MNLPKVTSAKRYPSGGFTLIETLVAISILAIIIVGPITITVRSAKSSTFAAEQAMAYFLAQEGLELAQKGRDQYLLSHLRDIRDGTNTTPRPWYFPQTIDATEGFLKPTNPPFGHCLTPSGCGLERRFDATTGGVILPAQQCPADPVAYQSVGSANPCRIYYNFDPAAGDPIGGRSDVDRGAYTHVPTTFPTPFTRVIRFENPNEREVRVVSTVYWRTGTIVTLQRVELETYLFNIYVTP